MEINAARAADGLKIGNRVLVDDVRTQRDVVGGGHAQLPSLVQYAVLPVGEAVLVLVDIACKRFAVTKALPVASRDRLVHPAPRFLPHTEGAVLNGSGYILGGPSKVRQLEVVDGARAVARQVGDKSIAHQRDQVAGQAVFYHMRAHGQYHGVLVLPCCFDTFNQSVEFFPAPVRHRGDAGG